jgi:RNA polymerase sigma-70 factor (ECF subfamily)
VGKVRTDGPEELRKRGFSQEALPHMASVYRFAQRLAGGQTSDAEDLVQETFLRAYRSWESFTKGSNCRAWLFTICRNVHLGMGRRAAVRPKEVRASELDGVDEAFAVRQAWSDDGVEDPQEALFRGIVDEEVLRAVDALPGVFREALVLSDLEGLSYGEIGDILQLPPGTVKSRIFRARRLLHDALYQYAVEMGHIRPGTP